MDFVCTLCTAVVEQLGDDISRIYDKETLVLVNHLSTGDTPVLMYTCQRNDKVANNMCWIMYVSFKWLPFGWVSQVHGDYFISSVNSLDFLSLLLLYTYLQ